MQALAGARIAAAVLTLFAGATAALAQEDLDDLEVTMEVVDDVVELEASIRGLRGPGERGDFSADVEDAAEPAGDVTAVMIDADFEAQDDFEEGEDVDEDEFDELPELVPDPMP